MASRGFLIRFIDIGLIVLFGFLMISEIENATRVELASAVEDTEADDESPEERAFTVVAIAPDGSFALRDPASGNLIEAGLDGPDSLARALAAIARRDQAAGSETIVLIQPHAASPVQRTVDVMDVCDRLSLARSLQMELPVSEAEAAP